MSRDMDDSKLNNYGREHNSQKRGGNSRFSVVIKKKKEEAKPDNRAESGDRREQGSEGKRLYPFERRAAEGGSYGRGSRGENGRRGRGSFSEKFSKRERSGNGRPNFTRGGVMHVDASKEHNEREYIFDEENALLKIGDVGILKVKELTKIGAFLDIGLPKDILLPFREQTYGPKPGEDVLVYIYKDKSGRPAATMRVYSHLSAESVYEKDDIVEGMIYEISEKLGAFVAVDDKYFGLIPPSELYQGYKEGDRVECRVINRRDDGKLDLSPRKKAYQQMEEDAETVMEELVKNGGQLPYDDKSISAEEVKEIYHMSKAQFKRALGKLLKEKRVEISEGRITKL